jgi:hypothetical protein
MASLSDCVDNIHIIYMNLVYYNNAVKNCQYGFKQKKKNNHEKNKSLAKEKRQSAKRRLKAQISVHDSRSLFCIIPSSSPVTYSQTRV